MIKLSSRSGGKIVVGSRLSPRLSALIVVDRDHGYQLGENSQWAKITNFESATRIPFMVKLPTVFGQKPIVGRTTVRQTTALCA